MTGPFDAEAEVRALPAVQAVYDAFNADPGVGKMAPHSHRLLCEALAAAGVELGAYDHRIVAWLSQWGPEVSTTVAGWITRARSLDHDQAVTVLSALEDASEGIRERSAWCPACQSHPAGLCDECSARLTRADEYDALAATLRGDR